MAMKLRSEGDSMFDHWIQTMLMDLVRVLGVTERETWEGEKWHVRILMGVSQDTHQLSLKDFN